jgi:hypothetical protein
MINQPPHYTQGNVECIDAMVSAFGQDAVWDLLPTRRIQIFKYIWRLYSKDNVESNTRKALWFLLMSLGDDPRHE